MFLIYSQLSASITTVNFRLIFYHLKKKWHILQLCPQPPAPSLPQAHTGLLAVAAGFLVRDVSCGWNHTCGLLYLLPSLSTRLPRFTHVITCRESIFAFFADKCRLYGCILFCYCIPQLMGIWWFLPVGSYEVPASFTVSDIFLWE